MSKRVNNRKEKFLKERKETGNIITQSGDLIKFNFKFFVSGDKYGQSFEEWQKEKILAELNEKLKAVSSKTKMELLQDATLEIYSNGYPYDSFFEKPKALEDLDIKWARIRVTGRRRLIGFFLPKVSYENDKKIVTETDTDIFFVVFLDKDHQFAPYKKRNT